jgi:hypothetical protein
VKAFFTSHRNSLEAHLSLVEKTGCSALLHSKNPLPVAQSILNGWPMESATVPELEFFLDEEPVEIIPFLKSFDEVKDEPFCILHTSGSTGIPKPVPVTYGSYGGMDSQLLIPSRGHKPTFLSYVRGKRVFFALPVFHAASLNWTVGNALFAGVIIVLPPPAPLTADLASQIFQHSDSYGAVMAPSLVVDCYNNDDYCLSMLQNLQFIVYGGGMLPEDIGDSLSRKIRLLTLMGSCETALLPHHVPDDAEDWEYISLSPCLGHEFRYERDGLSNLIIVRNKIYELHQGVFSTFPQKEKHALGDLFEPHPLRPDLWRFRARADDIISFTTAEKLNPSTMESTIQANPLVRSAVIGGQGQFQASLLVEPRIYPKDSVEEMDFINQIWPSIAQANRDCPAHGRIMKGFVMLTNPEKPLPRASKDTVQRHSVFKLYEAEWKDLYDRAQLPLNNESDEHVHPPFQAHKEAALNKNSPDPFASLSDEMRLTIETIVERRVSLAFEEIASALSLMANKLQAMSCSPTTLLPTTAKMPNSVSVGTNDVTTGRMEHVNSVESPSHSKSKESVETQLRKIIHDTITENLEIDNLKDEDDLFKFGLDSLQVGPLLKAINLFIIKSKHPIGLLQNQDIFSNPTVAKIIALVSK